MNSLETIPTLLNGIDTDKVLELATKITENDGYGQFRFRANNHWGFGSRSRSHIQGFYAGGEEKVSRVQALFVDTDQPDFLGGTNSAPNPVEHLLHSLNSCLSTTLVYHSSVQGIPLESVNVYSEGEINAEGFFGISETVNKGYERIHVTMKVKGDADVDTFRQLAMYSPVYEMISNAVPVDFAIAKI